MANDSAQDAIERLDGALRRAEAAVTRLRMRPGRADLAARHHKLQDEVQGAIADLDRLIDAAETD